MNAEQAIKDLIPTRDACNVVKECRDELQREIATRKRVYAKWIAKGDLTETEAFQRLKAMMGAMLFLDQFVPGDAKLDLSMQTKPF